MGDYTSLQDLLLKPGIGKLIVNYLDDVHDRTQLFVSLPHHRLARTFARICLTSDIDSTETSMIKSIVDTLIWLKLPLPTNIRLQLIISEESDLCEIQNSNETFLETITSLRIFLNRSLISNYTNMFITYMHFPQLKKINIENFILPGLTVSAITGLLRLPKLKCLTLSNCCMAKLCYSDIIRIRTNKNIEELNLQQFRLDICNHNRTFLNIMIPKLVSLKRLRICLPNSIILPGTLARYKNISKLESIQYFSNMSKLSCNDDLVLSQLTRLRSFKTDTFWIPKVKPSIIEQLEVLRMKITTKNYLETIKCLANAKLLIRLDLEMIGIMPLRNMCETIARIPSLSILNIISDTVGYRLYDIVPLATSNSLLSITLPLHLRSRTINALSKLMPMSMVRSQIKQLQQ
jgi:hypothetical protein